MALYSYRGENHDWDMTLGSARTMLDLAQKSADEPSVEFAAQTSSMLLSITSVESFTNSFAFALPQGRPQALFSYRKYLSLRGFWPRINAVCRAAGISPKVESEPFDILKEAHDWRNFMIHTEPYSVSSPAIENTGTAVHQLHAPNKIKEYPGRVNQSNAERYFHAAKLYVDSLISATGIEPRAIASYTLNGETILIERNTPY